MTERRTAGTVAIASSLCAVLAFVGLQHWVFAGTGAAFDVAVSQGLVPWRSGPLTALFMAFTFLCNTDTLFVVGFIALVWSALARSGRRDVACVILTLLLVMGVNTALKDYFARVRPDLATAVVHETSYSFPSGHAMVSLCLFGFLAYLAVIRLEGWRRRAAVAGAVACILMVGMSRVYLGAHYPCDVLGGYLAGVPCLTVGILTYRRMT